jgi:hypothetical protein
MGCSESLLTNTNKHTYFSPVMEKECTGQVHPHCQNVMLYGVDASGQAQRREIRFSQLFAEQQHIPISMIG